MTTNELYAQMGVSQRVLDFGAAVLAEIAPQFAHIDAVAEHNQAKVIQAMQENRLAAMHFNPSTGYGYDDDGRDNLERIYARIFGTEAALVRPQITCGTHALALALAANLLPGDELLSPVGAPYDTLAGVIGTRPTPGSLAEYGVSYRQVDLLPGGAFDYDGIRAAINEKTRVIFAETIGNPKLDVVDIEKLAETAHKHNLPLVMDNTVATAYLVRPIEKGADIVVNSTSKYINANSDAISGVITDSGAFRWDKEKYPGMAEYAKFGKFAFTAKLRNGLFRNTGACLSPQTAFYNLLGMETLGLRMERACDNAKKLAEFLNTYPDVTVNYPGLSDSLWHAQAEKVLQNGYGAILTIRVGSKERAFDLINTLTIPKIVSNIGDTKTLIIHPESTLNAHSTQKEKEEAGVFDDLIRISVGIEDVEDLIEDFKHALK